MKKLLKIVLVSSLSLLCFSCYYDEEIILEEIIIDPGTEVKFSTDIIPIFTGFDCARCHDGSQDPDLRAGNEYNSLVPAYVIKNDGANSEIYKKLDGGHQGFNNDTQLALLKEWINRGALNN